MHQNRGINRTFAATIIARAGLTPPVFPYRILCDNTNYPAPRTGIKPICNDIQGTEPHRTHHARRSREGLRHPHTFGYCNADEEQANPPYDFVIDLGKEVTVRGFQFNQRYMTTGKPEAGARYGIAHLEVWTAKEITGDGLGAANDANWTYTQTYRDYRTDPDSPLDPMGVVISPMLDDYQHARYVRLRIHASYTNKTYNPTFRGWCIAELNVWGNNELLE